MAGAEARMRVSSVILPAIVLRHVQIGADEDALASEGVLVDQVLQTGEVQNSVHWRSTSQMMKERYFTASPARKPYCKQIRKTVKNSMPKMMVSSIFLRSR